MDVKAWIALAGLGLSIVAFFIGQMSSKHAQGEKTGTLASDIGYIKAGIDDLKSELRSIKSELADVKTRLAKAEESVKSAHKRIDELRAQ